MTTGKGFAGGHRSGLIGQLLYQTHVALGETTQEGRKNGRKLLPWIREEANKKEGLTRLVPSLISKKKKKKKKSRIPSI